MFFFFFSWRWRFFILDWSSCIFFWFLVLVFCFVCSVFLWICLFFFICCFVCKEFSLYFLVLFNNFIMRLCFFFSCFCSFLRRFLEDKEGRGCLLLFLFCSCVRNFRFLFRVLFIFWIRIFSDLRRIWSFKFRFRFFDNWVLCSIFCDFIFCCDSFSSCFCCFKSRFSWIFFCFWFLSENFRFL